MRTCTMFALVCAEKAVCMFWNAALSSPSRASLMYTVLPAQHSTARCGAAQQASAQYVVHNVACEVHGGGCNAGLGSSGPRNAARPASGSIQCHIHCHCTAFSFVRYSGAKLPACPHRRESVSSGAGGLACAGGPREEHVAAVRDQQLQQVGVAHGVDGGDQNLVERGRLGNVPNLRGKDVGKDVQVWM